MAITRDNLTEQLIQLQGNGQLAPAIDHWKSLLASAPPAPGMDAHLDKVAALLNNCGTALFKDNQIGEALGYFTLALRARDRFVPALNNAATCLKELGRMEESSAAYRQALELQPHFAEAHSNLLLNMHYQSGIPPQELATAHQAWDARHGSALHKPMVRHPANPNPERPLRVGLVSADLGQHPVGICLVRYLENADPAQVAFSCYTTTPRTGGLTDRIKKAVAHWHDAHGMDDEALARKIHADGIDILIDLNGHTAGNRLGVFARKPAPIQIGWLGYPGDNGLAAMDYVIGDRFVLPETMQPFMHARILNLPDNFICFDTPQDAPPVSALPATVPGAITLGAFHNPAKCGADVIALWANILNRLPEARLLFKYKGFGAAATQEQFQKQFAAYGILPSRLEFQGESPLHQMFAEMGRVDLALDPFPFAGGLMTCLTLWMGVPVLTLPGASFASRQGLSFLTTIGITDTIATSAQDYADKAVVLAHDLPHLASLRARLRLAMASSPLCDGKKAAANLEKLLRQVWRDACAEAGKENAQ